MKKRMLLLFLALGMVVAGCGNKETKETPEIEVFEETTMEENEKVEEAAEETLSFSEFENLEFHFSSGAGGWRTILIIKEDGSFSGQYSDSDMGDREDEYPNGTLYLCDFEGKFTLPAKLNEYTYCMQIEEINYEKKMGTEEIIDGTLYCYSNAFGLDDAKNILVYLPGAPFSELPEDYRIWVRNDMADPDAAELPFYGLYNVTEQTGFSSYDISTRIDDMMTATEEWALTVRASLENDPLNQAELNEKAEELYDIWDAALNILWDDLKNTLSEEKMADLLDEQRQWITDKEQAVEEAGSGVAGGSMQPMVMNLKAAELTEERVYELLKLLE